MINDNYYFQLLEKLYKDSPEFVISKKDKIVIFSDLHMGDGRSMDDFYRNSDLFLSALDNYYYKNNYTLILNGDVEELQRYNLGKIKKQWKDIYDIFCKFHENKRLYKIYGNHDSALFGYKEGELGCPTLKSLILTMKDKKMFIFHGHQASFIYNTFDDLMRISMKFIAVPLRIKSYSVAHNNTKKSHVEKMAYDFARNKQIVSIIGHTHRPLFESRSKMDTLKFRIEFLLREYQNGGNRKRLELEGEIRKCKGEIENHLNSKGKDHSISSLYSEDIIVPSIFNSGCVIGKRGMTCLEIFGGNIYLIHWYGSDIDKKYVKKDIEYVFKLEGTDYIRHILKHDSLDYIFTRIRLLS
ncbi:MAG: metallophosphoesterase family protein [Spirochaetales bacterium]|nr:metallophosphoesterase family protein [Spirochaetales bacterium]